MAVGGRVKILNETPKPQKGEWRLHFQRVLYVYDDGSLENGYRFIWRRPDGSLQGARGQARIPSLKEARVLMAQAEREGWGHWEANEDGVFPSGKDAA